MNTFSEIKSRIALPDAARLYGIALDRHGKALCPLHAERTPSFHIKGQRWQCFGCGRGGSVIDLVMGLFGLDATDAARKLDADFGLSLYGRDYTPEERRAAAEAARQREADKALVDAFGSWWKDAWHTVTWYRDWLRAQITVNTFAL